MSSTERRPSFVTRWLLRRDTWVLNVFAVSAAFCTYFSMYAFRKPFAAATFEGEEVGLLLGGSLEPKSLFIISQLLGYAISKYVGVRVNSEVTRSGRFRMLVGLILLAEAALLLFALAPDSAPRLRALALFANGLPLGMVWGLVVQYLEGRRMSEVLLTGLSCSYILASGVVKDVGRTLLAGGDFWIGVTIPNPLPQVSDFWMPFATGALFFPAFLVSAWLLEQLPDPSPEDQAARVRREPMEAAERRRFLRRYAVAIVAALLTFFVLTAFRDYRDTYMVEAFTELGFDYDQNKTIISQAETLVAFGVAIVLSQLYRFRDNRRGLAATYVVMSAGLLLMGGATLLLDTQRLDGFWWITLIGLGAYIAYIPFGAVLFDRAIACSGFVGTAVFGIYIADAIGYTGSLALYFSADTLLDDASHSAVLRMLCYGLALGGTALLAISCVSFLAPKSDLARAASEPAATV